MRPASVWLLPPAVLLLAAATGCTHDQVLGFAYHEAQQHRCMEQAEHKPNQSMEEFKCMSEPAADRGQSWEDYKRAREQEVGG